MAIRDQLRANAAHLLQPGETVQAVFCAQTTSGYYALLSTLIIILSDAYRVVVVTDKRILVCRSGRFRMTPVKDLIRELLRHTRIGPRAAFGGVARPLGSSSTSTSASTRT
jgi:hypothetical protein